VGVALRITTAQASSDDGSGRLRGVERSDAQPRVPIIGLDSGCIPGTKPGSSAAELERAGRDTVRSRLARRRFKPA
jgi:hypothetical protein